MASPSPLSEPLVTSSDPFFSQRQDCHHLLKVQNKRLKFGLTILSCFSFSILLSLLFGSSLWKGIKWVDGVSSVGNFGASAVKTDNSFHNSELTAKYGKIAEQILLEAEKGADKLYDRLKEISFSIGARLSGQPSLDEAIRWVKAHMEEDELEEVRLQEVEGVSHWLRGEEFLEMVYPRKMKLSMIGLGGSVGGDIWARVISVSSFEELESRAGEAVGKIVLFNAPFVSYGETVIYRVAGAVAAAKVGAVASLVRSVSSFSMGNPHTGAMSYGTSVAENLTLIPGASVSTEHADMIHWLLASGKTVKLHLKMSGKEGKPALSHNVLGQLTGYSKPNEVITMGGHIDSWDIGLGSMDDLGGLLVTWEAVRILKVLGLRSRRTVRVVAFTNEEEGGVNGVLGGRVYAKNTSNEKHILAIESDSGAFNPEGFFFVGSNGAYEIISKISSSVLGFLNATTVMDVGFSGTDVHPLTELYGTASMELKTEASKYFWYHHSVADTPDKLNATEMARCAATLATMAYVVSELEEPLPLLHT